MFQLLLKVRLQTAVNLVVQTWRRSPLVATALTVVSVVLFGGMTVAFVVFFAFAARLGILRETVYEIFYFLFLFLLAGAVPFVASTLLQSSDYGLLFVAPVPPRLVVAAKLLDATVTNSLQFTVLGIPAIVACGLALHIAWWGWILIPLLTMLFVLLPALLTALALLVALAGLGMRRLRGVVTLINALMAVSVCATFVLESKHLPIRLGDAGRNFTGLTPAMSAASPAAHLLPSHWFADVLLALSSVETIDSQEALRSLALLIGLVGGLYGFSVLLGGRLLSAASVAEENSSGGTIGGDVGRHDGNAWRRVLRPQLAALLWKDGKYIVRDTMLLSQLGVPLILYAVPFLLALQDRSLDGRSEIFPFCAAITGIIVFMQTSILSLSLLGMEGESFWAALIAPGARSRILWAKWLLSSLLTGSVGVVLTLFAGVIFRAAPGLMLAQTGIVVLSATALCALGVAISAIFPRFVHDNPAMRVSAWALITGFFATTGYALLSGVIWAMAWLIVGQMGEERGAGLTWSLAALLYLIVTLLCILLPMQIAAHRLERYEWEH